MRIAIAQINPTLGDFEKNKNKILEFISRAKEKHCDLVIFPEAALFGYHPFDMLEMKSLVKAQNKYIREIEKKVPKGMAVLMGTLVETHLKLGKPYYNSALWIVRGAKTKIFHKQLLPTGDVFDEARFIENGKISDNVLSYLGKKILITICEDIWAWPSSSGKSHYLQNPLKEVARKNKNIDLVLNLSASPFYPGKEKTRSGLLQATSKLFRAPMVYCNMVGAQDEIIFDGQSFAVDKTGREIARLMPFEEDLGVLDLHKMQGMKRTLHLSRSEMQRRALALGLRDFCDKTGIASVHLGLSGGIDSALVACLAVDALGPNRVKAFYLPSEFSSDLSRRLAFELSKNLKISCQEVSIQPLYQQAKQTIDSAFSLKKMSTVHENLQARIRGMILMAHANATSSLLLATSNKTETAAGYATMYGDMCGGLMPIADLTKQEVYQLCEIYNKELEVIPTEIFNRAPSAELRPNQKDQDSLPPYDQLDQAVEGLVVEGREARTSAEKWLLPVLLKTEFKRWQAPPIFKISKHSFGRGRRWPIAHQAQKNIGTLKKR